MTLLNCPSSLQPPSLFMLMTSFSRKKFLLQPQCPLFNPTSILFHCGLPLIILPSTQKKTKYMIVSCKPPSFLTSLSPLFLDSSQLERVNSFKYIGIIITSNLSWSHFTSNMSAGIIITSNLSWSLHIQYVHTKARQTIGIIYHNFYKHASPHTLISLCIALLSFAISPTVPLFGNHPYLPLMLKFSRKPNTALKMCSHNGTMITHLFSQLLTFRPSQLVTLFSNYVFSIKSLTISSTFPPLFSFTSLSQVMSLITLILSLLLFLFSHSSASQNSFVPSVLSL